MRLQSEKAKFRPRLDIPREPGFSPRKPSWSPETFAALAERTARFLGTWDFIGYMSAFVIMYIGWNQLAPHHIRFDDYPYNFLTLVLSLQASYAAPLILLAQNRQGDRDRVTYEQDRGRAERSNETAEFLTREIAGLRVAVNEVTTRDYLRSELVRLMELNRAADRDAICSELIRILEDHGRARS